MAKKKAAKKKTGRRGGRKPGKWVHLTQDAVEKFRKVAKLSRAKLAELLGVSVNSVTNWETGGSVPIARFQQRLVELIKGKGPSAAPTEVAAPPPRRRKGSAPTVDVTTRSAGVAPLELQVTRLTVAGEIMKSYLATAQGGKISPEQLVKLTAALRGALG